MDITSAGKPTTISLKETDEHRQMRRIAFVAVVVSTVAVIASVVTLPMLYNYVQSFQSHLQTETDYCKARARDMWLEMTALQMGKGHANRIKRGWLFGQWIPESGDESNKANSAVGNGIHINSNEPAGGPQGPQSSNNNNGYGHQPASNGYGPVVNSEPAPICCTCNVGAPGLAGPEGEAGDNGEDGANGKDGINGRDAQLKPADAIEPCLICPPGAAGPQGYVMMFFILIFNYFLDKSDPKDHQDPKDHPVSHHVMVYLAIKECKDNPDQLVDQDVKDHAEHPVNQDVLCKLHCAYFIYQFFKNF